MAGLTPSEVRSLLDRHGITPSRALGQNFVIDQNTIARIVRLADVGPDDRVVEVGPGLGSLTSALADAAHRVVAIEADRHLLPALQEVLGSRPNVEVINADALTYDYSTLGPAPWKLVANLPYNVATPLVLDLLDDVPAVEELSVMVQREVAERLVAAPGEPAFGLPSLKVRYWATGRMLGRVPASVFHPRPRVESAIVGIVRLPPGDREKGHDELFALAKRAFGQRRKMLRRSLSGVVDPDAYDAARVAPTARPEELDVADWARLAEASSADL